MPFAPLEDFLDDSITLPIRGKEYVIQSPDSEIGLWVIRLRQLISLGEDNLSDADRAWLEEYNDLHDEAELQRRVLGDAFEQMKADHVPWAYVKRATAATMAWIAQDRAAAEEVWAAVDIPKAPESRQPQDRKPKAGSRPRKAAAATPGPTS